MQCKHTTPQARVRIVSDGLLQLNNAPVTQVVWPRDVPYTHRVLFLLVRAIIDADAYSKWFDA